MLHESTPRRRSFFIQVPQRRDFFSVLRVLNYKIQFSHRASILPTQRLHLEQCAQRSTEVATCMNLTALFEFENTNAYCY